MDMNRVEQQFRIAEIDVCKIATEERIAGVFRFEQAGTASRGPTLLIIADIHSSLYMYERLLDLLNSTAEQARHLVAGVGGQDPVNRFEKLVQRVNEAITGFADQEAAPFNWKRVNIFLLEMTEGHLCFTGVGRLMNAFFQKQPDGSFRSFDLLGSLEQPIDVDEKKVFSSIVCGDINPGDVLIAGTENMERFRGELQMKERLTTLPPVTAALEIRSDLERRGVPDHFVAAVISCQEMKIPVAEARSESPMAEPKDQSTASIEKLRAAEAVTSERLAPAMPKIRKLNAARVLASAQDLLRRTQDLVLRKARGRDKKPPVDQVAMTSLRGMNAGYGSFFTKRRKTVTYGIIGFACVILFGGLWWRHARQVSAETTVWNATFDGATDQRNRAESDLIYGNDARAKSEIDAAEQAIAPLPVKNGDETSKIKKLRDDLAGLKDRLKKLTKADNVTELTALASTADGDLAAPVLDGDTAYVADNASGAILKINLTSKNVKTIRLASTTDRVIAGTKGKDSVIFATAAGKLLAVNKTTDAVSAMAWAHSRTSSTKDILLYANRLYSLDPTHNQIWRSSNTGGGFGGESSYIKATSAEIGNAVSIAIDSSVYILESDGTVLRFLSGGQEGFSLVPIDPPLTSGSAIWTGPDSDRVAIADPAQKRIVFFDKNGALKAQVISSQFQSPRDLDADETNKRMIVVDGNRLLLVPMP